jgi:hypothetical protein
MSDFSVSDQQVNHQAILEDSGNDFMNVILANDTLNVIWGDVRSGSLKIYFTKRGIYDATNHITTLPVSDVRIFPNPFVTEIVLPKNYYGLDYYILSTEGKTLLEGKIDQEKLSMEELPKGTYHLLIVSPEKRYQYQLVKP